MDTCSVAICDRPVRSKGYCQGHYVRQKNGGDLRPEVPLGAIERPTSVTSPCSVDGCPNLVGRGGCRGWCPTHYNRWQSHGDVQAHIPIAHPTEVVDGMKACTSCRGVKPVSEFGPSARTKSTGLTSRCRECLNGERRAYCEKNSDHIREQSAWASRKYRFGITEEQYNSMLESQGGVCKICKSPPANRRLSIDHDHSCCVGPKTCGNCIRALLCNPCNTILGLAGDEPDRLRAAAKYLED